MLLPTCPYSKLSPVFITLRLVRGSGRNQRYTTKVRLVTVRTEHWITLASFDVSELVHAQPMYVPMTCETAFVEVMMFNTQSRIFLDNSQIFDNFLNNIRSNVLVVIDTDFVIGRAGVVVAYSLI